MKVLGIVCSPRKGGNTEIMMEAALAGARSLGAETELWSVAGKNLLPCDGCFACRKKGVACHIKDDMQELYPKILAADGLIFGSPSYFLTATAQAKIILDRLFALYNQYVLADKVAGVVTVADARGHEGVWHQFSNFFSFCHMFSTDFAFGFAREKGDVRKDECAMKGSEELGRQIVSLLRQKPHWPEQYRRPLYRILREDQGIDTCPTGRYEQAKHQR